MGAERVDYCSDGEFEQAQQEEERQEYQRQEEIEAEERAEEEHYQQLEETKRKNAQLDALVREWEDMDNAPKDQPLILKDDNGFIYVGEYNHNYGYFGQYTDEGVVEHQHAMKWKPLPTT